MKPNQSLVDITANSLIGLNNIIIKEQPNIIFVQGDTTTAFIGALAGFYSKVEVAHLEAGLRTNNKYSPYPEEMNRILAGHISDFHFAPTNQAKTSLNNESITNNVWVVGNTVVDALFLGLDILKTYEPEHFNKIFNFTDFNKKIILVTGHRRESFGGPFINICKALKSIAQKFNDIEIIYPVHLNPNVQKPVYEMLKNISNIHLIEPLDYPYLIWLMNKSHIVLTDSGGIQEEAPSLGKPVLVMRDVTERMEGVNAGTAKLVGTDQDSIVNNIITLLTNEDEYLKMSKSINPYGDGTTSMQIINILKDI